MRRATPVRCLQLWLPLVFDRSVGQWGVSQNSLTTRIPALLEDLPQPVGTSHSPATKTLSEAPSVVYELEAVARSRSEPPRVF